MKTEIKNNKPARTNDGSRPARAPVNRYKALLKRSDTALAKQYSSKDKYQTGDVLEHASFGRGIATAVKGGTKVEVLFESGSKILIQGTQVMKSCTDLSLH